MENGDNNGDDNSEPFEDIEDEKINEYNGMDPNNYELNSDNENMNESNQEKTENITDTIKDIKIKVTTTNPKPSGSEIGPEGNTEIDDPNGEIVVPDVPGTGGSGSQQSGGGGGDGGGKNPGDGGGDIPVEHRKSLSSIMPAKVRSMMKNKNNGEYAIVFTPTVSAENGVLELYMSAESQNYPATIIEAKCDSCPDAVVSGNKISNLTFTAQEALKFDIRLDYSDYCSLEVKAYGNKI